MSYRGTKYQWRLLTGYACVLLAAGVDVAGRVFPPVTASVQILGISIPRFASTVLLGAAFGMFVWREIADERLFITRNDIVNAFDLLGVGILAMVLANVMVLLYARIVRGLDTSSALVAIPAGLYVLGVLLFTPPRRLRELL